MASLYVATPNMGIPLNVDVWNVLTGAWFFRDWAPVAPINGVAWTLEAAAKFYLFIVVLWFSCACKRIWPVIVAAGIMVWVDKCKTAAPCEFHLSKKNV